MVLNENLTNRASWREGRQTDGRTDSPCVLQDFVPFGAAALLPLNLNHFLLKQGTGTADHLLPLGCYFDLKRTTMHNNSTLMIILEKKRIVVRVIVDKKDK